MPNIKNKKKLTVITLLSLIIVLVGIVAFRNIGPWLIVSDPIPKHLDALFTFGGEAARNVYSQELFKKNLATTWIISTDEPKVTLRKLRRNKIDTAHIQIVDTCKNTRSEVAFCKEWLSTITLSENKTYTLGLVSGPYHMRRIRIMVNKMGFPNNVSLVYLPVPLSYYRSGEVDYSHWWENKALRELVMLEFKKILAAIIL